MEICIDFDGTCVAHEYPLIGKDIGAVPVLKELVDKGHRLILFTMRGNTVNGKFLDEAVQWFHENDIPLWGIQKNPEQEKWTPSPKAYGQLYIDDAALGAPLKINRELTAGPFYDWETARQMLIQKGIL